MRHALFAVTLAAAGLLGCHQSDANAQVSVQAPWLRATPPGVSVGAGYATIRNDGDAPRKIVSVETPLTPMAMIHEMRHENGMMQMREADGLVVPAHGSVQLAPGGYHLMLMNLQQPLSEGQSAELTFVLDDGTRVKATFPVRASAP